MSPEEIERSIVEANACARLGMWWEAWDILESLPPAARKRPAVLAVRLLVCTGLARWEMGVEIARQITPEHRIEEREAAGRFHLAHAESLCAAGSIKAAKESIRELSVVWPEGRELALNSTALDALR